MDCECGPSAVIAVPAGQRSAGTTSPIGVQSIPIVTGLKAYGARRSILRHIALDRSKLQKNNKSRERIEDSSHGFQRQSASNFEMRQYFVSQTRSRSLGKC